jgi:small-conductance mechanosensitive channel
MPFALDVAALLRHAPVPVLSHRSWFLERFAKRAGLCRALTQAVAFATLIFALGGPAAVLALDPAQAATLPQFQTDAASAAPTIFLNHRPIVSLRATLLGRSPVERAQLAELALQAALHPDRPGKVTVWLKDDTAGLQLDGRIVFYLVPGDIEGVPGATLAESAGDVQARLQTAVQEVQEMGDPRRIAEGVGRSLIASGLAWLVLQLVFVLRRRTVARTLTWLEEWQRRDSGKGLITTYTHYARTTSQGASALLTWALVVVVADVWVSFVLGQFAFTRPWAELSSRWLIDVLEQFSIATLSAIPGVLSALLIFFLARLVARANAEFMGRVESGELQVGWLDRDTAGPTRRVANFVIWLFALAMAYPYLPGANTEAFKGVSVLAGLMLSLGASSVVGQIISGLSLMYSGTLRTGEFVKIGDTEGTVSSIGMFATRIHTSIGEEVSLPNGLVFSQSVRNWSRLVKDGQFLLHTAVTIGYGTPWRQVHAMLLEAARRSPGVAQVPLPYVVQTALSDFYVEYRLCAQSNRSAPDGRAQALNQLHGHILDVFNENGVQIMSPHYEADPTTPQMVFPEAWSPALARRQGSDELHPSPEQ